MSGLDGDEAWVFTQDVDESPAQLPHLGAPGLIDQPISDRGQQQTLQGPIVVGVDQASRDQVGLGHEHLADQVLHGAGVTPAAVAVRGWER